MSFDRQYANRKDKRKDYFDSREFDKTCRSHGNCAHCQKGRKYKRKKQEPARDF